MTPITVNRKESTLSFWRKRLAQHTADSYRGRGLAKMPEDLRTYQHLIEDSQPNAIVELGTWRGGSAVWFADQLTVLCGGGLVVTVDSEHPPEAIDDPRIVSLTGHLEDDKIVEAVRRLVRGRRVMVVEDAAHTRECTAAGLAQYAHLVASGCWYVVEDGIVDDPALMLKDWWGGGVTTAIDEFLRSGLGTRFTRRDMALYGLTTNLGGWLQAA